MVNHHAVLQIPDGDCDDDCEGSIAASQNNTAPAQFPATMMLGSESLLSPVERYPNMMRQRYHLPGQPAAPRDELRLRDYSCPGETVKSVPHPLRLVNLLQVLIGDSAPGKR
jgi:hypothetical protein